MFITRRLIVLLCPIIRMVFFTLLERKLIGYTQLRVGPNKVTWGGLGQAFLDAGKLLSKAGVEVKKRNSKVYFIRPLVGLVLSLLMWRIYPNPGIRIPFSLPLFLCISGLSVYGVLGAGWRSNSKYATLGATRSVAQTISYEVSMALILMGGVVFFYSWELKVVNSFGVIIVSPLIRIWFVSCLAETNRAPFDFVEGEREIVSGFNIEYSAVGFVIIFMAEYLRMLFLRFLSFYIFLSNCIPSFVGTACFCFIYV